jgi:ABC-type branched-subunit amino acid transport system substrate-binding protein
MLLCIAAAGLGGVAPGMASAQSANKVIKLGTYAPETGANSGAYPIAQATSAFFKALNAAGGINGYTFDYVIMDDQYNPALTVSAVRKLVEQDNVFAIVDGVGTGPTLAVKPYLEAHKVPSVAPSTGTAAAAGPYTWMMEQDFTNEGAYQAAYAANQLTKNGKLAVLYQNDDVGKTYLKGVQHEAQQNSRIRLTAIPFQLGTLDFTPAVSRARASGADVVIISATPQDFAPIVKAADALAYTPKWLSLNSAASADILRQLPATQTQNMYFSVWTALPDTPDVQDMNQALARYYPKVRPSALTIQGWIPGTIFAEAFRRMTDGGKPPTREGLVAALDSFKGYSNSYIRNITYAPTPGIASPHLPRPYEAITKWTGSKLELVTPFQEVPKVPGQPGQ